MSLFRKLRSSLFQADTGVTVVLIAVVMTGALTAVESLRLLPLESQAMPSSAGALPDVGGTHGAAPVKSSARAKTSSSKRSSSVARTAKSSSSSTNSSSAKALTSYEKLQAFKASGDLSCFLDKDCERQANRCSTESASCREVVRRLWTVNAFFPECPSAKDRKDCEKGMAYLLSDAAPKALKDCGKNVACRELLSNFRRGDFTCRTHWLCQDALEAMLADPPCETMQWCKSMKTIDLTYSSFAKKCTKGNTPECRKTLGIDRFVTTTPRRVTCENEIACLDGLVDAVIALGLDYTAPGDPGCFLLAECKAVYDAQQTVACDVYKNQKQCNSYTRVRQLLDGVGRSCITSGNTPICIDALKKAKN